MTKKNNGKRIKINMEKAEERVINEYKNKEWSRGDEDINKIIEICKEHKFYVGWVVGKLKQMKHKKSIHYILRDWGFMIYADYTTCKSVVLIEFIFILPEHRRQGHTTKALNIFKKNKDMILLTIDKKNMPMMCCCVKQGINPLAECRSGNELFFAWSDKYDDDFIMKNCY